MHGLSIRRKVVFRCEACHSPLIKRTSVLQHQFLRQDTYICENPVCGATYTGMSEVTSICSPSGMPSAASELPPSPGYLRSLALQAYSASGDDRQLDLLSPGLDLPVTTT